jgi:hypothetical protein
MSSSPLEKPGAVTSGQLEQNLNQNLFNGGPVQSTPDTQATLDIMEPLQSLLFKAQLRCYRVCARRVRRTVEFIGYRVARNEDENREPDASQNSHNLYKDIIGGWLVYSYGYEVKIGTSDVRVKIIFDRACCGKNLEEMRAKFRDFYGPDVEIPFLLESPPEVETMHMEVGYDS